MPNEKEPWVREQELLKEQTQLIGDWIRSDPEFVNELLEGIKGWKRGESVPFREVYEEWQRERSKPI